MPFALIFVGLILLVTSVRNNVTQGTPNLVALAKGDFTGQNNFVFWGVAIGGVSAIGYIAKLRILSDALLTLVMIALLLSHGDFFKQLMSQLSQTKSSFTAPLWTLPSNPLSISKSSTNLLEPLPVLQALGSLPSLGAQ